MSTKNLARTIIEGGRAGYNKWQRRHSNRKVRTNTRRYSRTVRGDPEEFDHSPPPVREPVYKGFADKLGAVRRWLRSQCGRPWNDVRSEMFRRFDPRSLAGQHIIFDHLLQEVMLPTDPYSPWRTHRARFVVDGRGILREGPGWTRRRAKLPKGKRWRRDSVVAAWTSGRKVGFRGAIGFWFVPTRKPVYPDDQVGYRQSRRMSGSDLAFWETIPSDQQERFEMDL